MLWGQTRYPLYWRAWTEFNAMFRTWQTNQSRPGAWSNFGTGPATVLYVQPVPDQTYTAYIDYFYVPEPLVDNTSVDELVYPFNDAVQYYAAHMAKFKSQSYGEADIFMKQYAANAMWALTGVYTRRMPDAYNTYSGR